MMDAAEQTASAASPVAAAEPAVPPLAPADSTALTRSAGRGAVWNLSSGALQTVIRLGTSTILARALTQADFGIVEMAVIARELIIRMGSIGIGYGIIAKPDADQLDLSTAFWANVFVQSLLLVIAMASAPLVAAYFKEPQLVNVFRVICLTFLFTGLSGVSASLIQKRLQFGITVLIQTGGSAVEAAGAIAMSLSFPREQRYWALVLAGIGSALLMRLATIACARWLPSFRFSWQRFRYLFRFGINNLLTQLVGYLQQYADSLLVGRLLGAFSLGLYSFASRIPNLLFDRAAQPLAGVIFPTLAKVSYSDERLAAGYVKSARYIALMVFPLLAGLAAVAHPAVAVMWGDKWLSIVPALQVLCLVAAARSVLTPAASVFLCKERPDVPFKVGLATMFTALTSVAVLGWLWGILGVALGMVVSLAPAIWNIRTAFKLLRCPLRVLMLALVPALAASAACGAVAVAAERLVRAWGRLDWLALLVAVPAGAAAYLAVLAQLFPATVREVKATARVVLWPAPPREPTRPQEEGRSA
jgi:PST family polysaccharide transporter